MGKCPKCDDRITVWQAMKHTRWTPVVCKNCKTKLIFNKKEWFKVTMPIFVVIIVSIMMIITKNPYTRLSLDVIFLILSIWVLIRVLRFVNDPKLEIKE